VHGEAERDDEQLIRLTFTKTYWPDSAGYDIGEELRNRDEPI
jgi:hypothetical protein